MGAHRGNFPLNSVLRDFKESKHVDESLFEARRERLEILRRDNNREQALFGDAEEKPVLT
jgi:hypothetical protein